MKKIENNTESVYTKRRFLLIFLSKTVTNDLGFIDFEKSWESN